MKSGRKQERNNETADAYRWCGTERLDESPLAVRRLTLHSCDSTKSKQKPGAAAAKDNIFMGIFHCVPETSETSVPNLSSAFKNLKLKPIKPRMLPSVLYGCETWSLTLMEERRLRISDYVAEQNVWTEEEGWTNLCNAELYNLYQNQTPWPSPRANCTDRATAACRRI
jgi:hypothetical protein